MKNLIDSGVRARFWTRFASLRFAAVLLAFGLLFAGCPQEANEEYTGLYTVTYNLNGGNGTVPDPQTVTSGSSVTLASASGFTKLDYIFGGWTLNSTSGTLYAAGASYTPTANVTFYAKWTAGGTPTSNLIPISGGTFNMGSPTTETNRDSDEEQHNVTVGSFCMSKYEVTQKEFADVMGQLPASIQSSDYYGKGDNYPVYYVSWYHAIAYCNKLSIRYGLTPAYTVSGISDWAGLAYSSIPTSSNDTWDAVKCDFRASGYRLPTEAEWEYACRAGMTNAYSNGKDKISHSEANFYPFNDGNDENPSFTAINKTTTVESYAANPWGLYDMHGNVYEWCWDWYDSDYYSSSPSSNPTGASSGSDRVVRGGSWRSYARYLRSANRGDDNPSSRGKHLGFRLLRLQV